MELIERVDEFAQLRCFRLGAEFEDLDGASCDLPGGDADCTRFASGVSLSAAAGSESVRFQLFDGDTQLPGGGRQTLIERDERRIEAPGNREMEGVRCSELQIKTPDINVGEPSIG
jgi:hypothetical protein